MIYTINLISKNNSGVLTTTDITSRTNIGFSKVEKLDDSLDIGQIEFRDSNPIPYTLFDVIQVKDENNNVLIDMRISGDDVSLISKSPLRYEHKVSLVEHTKILELFIVSGKTFTQPTDGTIEYTLYDVINRLRVTTPLEVVQNTGDYVLFFMPETNSELCSYLQSINSPEFTFKNTTLREALTQVCDYVDGIPRLVREEDGALRFTIDFVGEIKNLIADETIFIDRNKQIDNTYYAKEIESEALNLVSDNLYSEAVEIYPARNAFTTFRRADDFFQSNFEGSVLLTPKPIYDVSNITIQTSAFVQNVTKGNNILNYEVREFKMKYGILEKNSYDILTFKDYTGGAGDLFFANKIKENYKNDTLYYNYKEKNVYVGETYGLFGTQEIVKNWVKRSIISGLIEDGIIGDSVNELSDEYQVFIGFDELDNINPDEYLYQIQYIPIPDSTRLSIDKQNISEVNKFSTLISNQQGRVINLEQYANNIQGKINRIGNSDLKLSYRVKNVEDSKYYGIGDYTDQLEIVTIRESIFYQDFIYVNLDLTKDFNKISSFIGVNSEIRQYEIGEKDTLNRQLLYKEYIEIDVVASGNGSSDSKLLTEVGRSAYLSTFNEFSTFKAVGGGIQTNSANSNNILISPSSNGGGNSLIFSYRVEDNKSVSFYKEEKDSQITKQFIPYTEADGKVNVVTIKLIDSINLINLERTVKDDVYKVADTMPLLIPYGSETDVEERINSTYIDASFLIFKDNREIIGQTIQLQQISKDLDKVILGRALSFRNRLVSELPPQQIKIYVYNDGTQYNRTDNLTIKSGYESVLSVYRGISTLNNKITLDQDFSAYDSYAIADENDRLLLAVNNKRENLNTITFDFKNKRSGIIYKY